MKNLLLPLLAFLFLTACEKESTTDLQPDQEFKENGSVTLRSPAPKIDVCHRSGNGTWHIINISENAWPAHEAHGDVQLIDEDGDGWVTSENECGVPVDCDDTDDQLTDNCCPDFNEVTMDYETYFDLETGTECSNESCDPEYDLIWADNSLTSIHARMWWNEEYTDMALVYDRSFCELTCNNVEDYYFCEHVNDLDPACANTDTPPVDFVGIYETSEGNYWVVEWLSQDEANNNLTFRYRELCPQ